MKKGSLLKGNIFFEKYIRKNFIIYIVILSVYFIGFLLGIGAFNNNIIIDDAASSELSIFILEKLESISLKKSDAINDYIKQDFIDLIVISILSFSIIGIPIMIILLFIKALSLGITISALIHVTGVGSGLSFSILMFMLPTLLKIFAILMLICSSIKFTENIIKYKKEIKYEIIRHAFVNAITLIFFLVIVSYRYISINIVSQILF